MPEDFRVAVRSDPRLLSSVRGLVRTWIEEHGVAPELTARAVLAIDEACTNAIRHAYDGRPDEVVELVLRSAPEALEFVLSDRGNRCPKEKQRRRELAAPVKAPFSCPNSSDSIRFSGMAPQSTSINGPSWRGLRPCRTRAASSLPQPVSPSSRTVQEEAATVVRCS